MPYPMSTDGDVAPVPSPESFVPPDPITKVSIIVSKGSLEGVYPALIMANGARAEGMEANLLYASSGETASQLPSEFSITTPDLVSIL